jgi:hypothetical protein
MLENGLVDAFPGKKFEEEKDEHSKKQWLGWQIHSYPAYFQLLKVNAERCTESYEYDEIVEFEKGSPNH